MKTGRDRDKDGAYMTTRLGSLESSGMTKACETAVGLLAVTM